MIRVYKSKRLLEYTDASRRSLFSCPISLGSSPLGHKFCEGDGRTPEGLYKICSVNRQSKYHIALGISYPARKDAKSALSDRRIGIIAYLLICASDILRLRPPWKTPLGGFVMIHGSDPSGRSGDWTAGCIAISDADIEKLASLCRKGEQVEILP